MLESLAFVLFKTFVAYLFEKIRVAVIEQYRQEAFSELEFELGATQLGNAPAFGDTPFAEVAQTHIRVAMIPLLHGQIEIQTLQLKGLKCR
jgi:uncharacterized protein involved in outer membrane biogenesis